MGRTYTSVRGKEIDMEKLSLRNEKTPAVGNMRVNAQNPGAMREEVAVRGNKK